MQSKTRKPIVRKCGNPYIGYPQYGNREPEGEEAAFASRRLPPDFLFHSNRTGQIERISEILPRVMADFARGPEYRADQLRRHKARLESGEL